MLSDSKETIFEHRDVWAKKTASQLGLKVNGGGFDAVQWGANGGVVATIVMTAFRIPIARSLPPTADFWAQYIGGGDPDDYTLQGLLLHLLYGAGGGVVFALLGEPSESGSETKKEWKGILRGTTFGLLLSVVGVQIVLKQLLDMDLDPDERFIFHVSHIIYGITLGAWAGANT